MNNWPTEMKWNPYTYQREGYRRRYPGEKIGGDDRWLANSGTKWLKVGDANHLGPKAGDEVTNEMYGVYEATEHTEQSVAQTEKGID